MPVLGCGVRYALHSSGSALAPCLLQRLAGLPVKGVSRLAQGSGWDGGKQGLRFQVLWAAGGPTAGLTRASFFQRTEGWGRGEAAAGLTGLGLSGSHLEERSKCRSARDRVGSGEHRTRTGNGFRAWLILKNRLYLGEGVYLRNYFLAPEKQVRGRVAELEPSGSGTPGL